MKLRVGWFIILGVFIFIGIYVYNFFNEGNSIYKKYNYEFTMNIKDIANIEDEMYIKYLKVTDNKCKDKDCTKELLANLLIIYNPYIEKINLSSINFDEVKIDKSDYKIKLIDFDTKSKEITLKVINEGDNYENL